MNRRRKTRRGARGAAMVEAIIVISVFILFFVGMVYFRSLYAQKLRAQRLARAATVAYAMGACHKDVNPIDAIKTDLMPSASTTGSGAAPGTAKPIDPGAGPGGSLGKATGTGGFAGDPIAGVFVQGPAAGTTKANAWSAPRGFKANVGSYAYMSCGEDQHDGNASGMLDYIKGITSAF